MRLKLEYMLKMLLEVFFQQPEPGIIVTQSLFHQQVAGLPTNISFLQSLANHWAFEKGLVETHFIEHFQNDLFVASSDEVAKETYAAARFGATLVPASICEMDHIASMETLFGRNRSLSPWYSHPPFCIHHLSKRTMELEWEIESSGSCRSNSRLPLHISLKEVISLRRIASIYIYGMTNITITTETVRHNQCTDDESHQRPTVDMRSQPKGSVMAPMAGLVVKVFAGEWCTRGGRPARVGS